MKLPDGIKLEEMKRVYSQDNDCNESNANIQILQIEYVSNGTECYPIISTERWAINDEQGLSWISSVVQQDLKDLNGEPNHG